MRRREFISLLYSNLGQVVSAEFDSGNRQWVAVEVEMLRTEISDVDRLPVLTAARAMASPGPRRNTAPAPPLRRVCRWQRTVEGNEADSGRAGSRRTP